MSKKPSSKTIKLSSEDKEVVGLVQALLKTVEETKPQKVYLLVKSLGAFLCSCGEAIRDGSIDEARKIRLNSPPGAPLVSSNVGISLALMGDTIMDWSAGLRNYEQRAKRNYKGITGS